MKPGSGSIDFEKEDESEEDTEQDEVTEEEEIPFAEPQSDTDSIEPQGESGDQTNESSDVVGNENQKNRYPYFVRRENVADERPSRLEIFVRENVKDEEANYREELAEHLGTDKVLKTDAREFALLLAFKHPEKVAELMREEGYNELS